MVLGANFRDGNSFYARLRSTLMPHTVSITSDPLVMLGKPVIAGTRITVELILEKLASDDSISDILDAYPHLTHQGVEAAIEFARESVSELSVYPIE
jgi:uncharacterized protein (DUF433 family)